MKTIAINFEAKKQPKLTPMMQQYMNIKDEHRDCLLLYRMGDFYELFFEDAKIAAKILDIALTKRGKTDDTDIPMCGIPFHAYDNYIHKLVRAGHKVAICEQLETPLEAKKRGYKEIVRRDVIRIITAGTLFEENLLEPRLPNYLAAINMKDNEASIGWIDITTGEFAVISCHKSNLISEIERIAPKEIIISEKTLHAEKELFENHRKILTANASSQFDHKKNLEKLESYYNVKSIDVYDKFSENEIVVLGVILEYVCLTQKTNIIKFHPPVKYYEHDFMVIDASTRKSLELVYSTNGERKHSLLNAIDNTLTAAGGRYLYNLINAPLIDPEKINQRLDIVQYFLEHKEILLAIREQLKEFADLERAIGRIAANRGGPRDLLIVKNSVAIAFILSEILEHAENAEMLRSKIKLFTSLGTLSDLFAKLDMAINNEVKILARDGGFVRQGYHAGLDSLLDKQKNVKFSLDELKEKYKELTGIANLKLEYNNILGYYIEVNSANSSKMAGFDIFIHKHTTSTAVRYITIELKNLENEINSYAENILKIELEIFDDFVSRIMQNHTDLLKVASEASHLDIFTSFAYLASRMNYTRPIIDNSKKFQLEKARHPVVEEIVGRSKFIANNTDMHEDEYLMLITGPNMAGKSTYLRQNALIAIIAQIGCYVPAEKAHIGVVDRVFARVGASDDLANGRSTFMMEMLETSTILNQATSRSLIIFDELGRGTSTYDGLSIAWSAVEYLHNFIKARTFFATHYHELTALSEDLPSLRNYHVRVREWEGKIVFMYEVAEGYISQSYGIHVAELAGLPSLVIKRANMLLKGFNQIEHQAIEEVPQIFDTRPSEVEVKLRTLNPDELSAREALDLVYQLKAIIDERVI